MTKVLYASTTRHEEWLGNARYVCIVIHDTQEEFAKAAQAYVYNAPSGHFETAIGAFHPIVHREKYDKSKKKWVNNTSKHFAGTIRLCAAHVNYDVIVHEVVHAASHIFRMDVAKRVNLGTDCYQNEEWFAYIVGDLSSSVMESVKKSGFQVWFRD